MGDYGLAVYVFAGISIPTSAFRTLKAFQLVSTIGMKLLGIFLPYFIAFIFIVTGVRAVPIIAIIFSVFGWGWIPMSWYNFREKRWEEK
ncbi:MAG: hypothetical protein Q4P78_05905 [Rothia sp. (in: high G+C Gram-positive bacteria)]|nr:hypothetical protein [Rothia sp. (in: high G+C Gram-positive bacteria)]